MREPRAFLVTSEYIDSKSKTSDKILQPLSNCTFFAEVKFLIGFFHAVSDFSIELSKHMAARKSFLYF